MSRWRSQPQGRPGVPALAAACLPDGEWGGEPSDKTPRVTVTHTQRPQGVHARWGWPAAGSVLPACLNIHLHPRPRLHGASGNKKDRFSEQSALCPPGGVGGSHPAMECQVGPSPRTSPACAVNHRIPPEGIGDSADHGPSLWGPREGAGLWSVPELPPGARGVGAGLSLTWGSGWAWGVQQHKPKPDMCQHTHSQDVQVC